MKTAEPKTASVAKSTKANKPFFSKKGDGSFFDKDEPHQHPFFKLSFRYLPQITLIINTFLRLSAKSAGKINQKRYP